jgi:hypothetical protein
MNNKVKISTRTKTIDKKRKCLSHNKSDVATKTAKKVIANKKTDSCKGVSSGKLKTPRGTSPVPIRKPKPGSGTPPVPIRKPIIGTGTPPVPI